MEFTSNILTSSNQQKSFYLMLIICHTRIKVNIIVTILYHFIHLVSISVTAILRYPPLPFRDFAQKRGRRSWRLRPVEIQVPPTLAPSEPIFLESILGHCLYIMMMLT
nr:MAG TPA: hypothetical protein [Caudoviricetes sp.]